MNHPDQPTSQECWRVLRALLASDGALTADDLALKTSLPVGAVAAAVVLLVADGEAWTAGSLVGATEAA